MAKSVPYFRSTLAMIALLIGVGLACNAPLQGDDPTTSTSTHTATPAQPTATEAVPLGAPATVPSAPEQTDDKPTATTSPIDTPAQPTLGATVTASATTPATPTRKPTPTRPPVTSAPPATTAPLDFDFSISWRLSPADPSVAIATVTITARGGDGQYAYFRDDMPVAGPIFEYEWAACSANPGSLRVDSAGDTVRKDYFENTPCPTPTPTAIP